MLVLLVFHNCIYYNWTRYTTGSTILSIVFNSALILKTVRGPCSFLLDLSQACYLHVYVILMLYIMNNINGICERNMSGGLIRGCCGRIQAKMRENQFWCKMQRIIITAQRITDHPACIIGGIPHTRYNSWIYYSILEYCLHNLNIYIMCNSYTRDLVHNAII